MKAKLLFLIVGLFFLVGAHHYITGTNHSTKKVQEAKLTSKSLSEVSNTID
ncbi:MULTISPECIES: hypothetical protein [Flammeovirga]|uniref:Uncharacterized protein n=1 Tax=Flammeovirga agarivorans TaxID=2726742 RepID=A0A7X8XWV1_9BACT|nr:MULTISPECIES: hypothetical protein [Flammeovirga]NLR92642.1 hypothetical protein [Flammeovirga agarivorans]